MRKLLHFVGFLTSVSLLPGMAIADPTTGGREAAFSRAPSLAPVVSRTSPISKMSSVTDTAGKTCTTTASVALGKQISLSAPGNVSVHFTGEFFPGCRNLISLTRNGVVVPGPGDAVSAMAAHDQAGELSTNGFNWVVQSVPAGLHVFRVMCQCVTGTGELDERTMILYHN